MASVKTIDDSLYSCKNCGDEILGNAGRETCEWCDPNDVKDYANRAYDEPIWYSLCNLIEKSELAHGPWRELMALAQILHDLRIDDTYKLMHKLDVVYMEDDSKTLRGEYRYSYEAPDPNRFHREIDKGHKPKETKEPRLSNRRRAIMAQREKQK
jgi:hypothetical protein